MSTSLPAPVVSEELVANGEVRAIEPARAAPLPVVQATAVAATGFLAGAATVALARRRSGRKALKRGRGALPVVGSRSFLVDIHLLGR